MGSTYCSRRGGAKRGTRSVLDLITREACFSAEAMGSGEGGLCTFFYISYSPPFLHSHTLSLSLLPRSKRSKWETRFLIPRMCEESATAGAL